ncbi:MAG: signal recognition particle-docking protein FtsY [Alphaproteobacteria bacterium]|nr:signal recognition particle-docking protein FtsY [Alphaproteobacteria bacterium]
MFGKNRSEASESAAEDRKGWFARLKAGLGKSQDKITHGIDEVIEGGAEEAPAEVPAEPAAPEPERKAGLGQRLVRAVTRRRLDDIALEQLEEVLITADLGPATAARLVSNLGRSKFDKDVTSTEVREALAEDVAGLLTPVARPLAIDPAAKPHVVLVVGVNGTGKTTTIGKLGKVFKEEGKSVLLCAGDTFRAAAIDQLKIWGERIGVPVLAREQGSDSAGLAYDALEQARAEGTDVLLIDTAGRLHNRADLMAELEKIIRVLRKLDAAAPQSCLLVLDATTGQNAHAQVQTFQEMTEVTGLVVTKLDGSARGGVLVALADRFGLPVHAVGVGEGADDLRPFDARDFARSLMGLEG